MEGYADAYSATCNDPCVRLRELHAAHQVCSYSKATRNNVEVNFTVNAEPLAMAA